MHRNRYCPNLKHFVSLPRLRRLHRSNGNFRRIPPSPRPPPAPPIPPPLFLRKMAPHTNHTNPQSKSLRRNPKSFEQTLGSTSASSSKSSGLSPYRSRKRLRSLAAAAAPEGAAEAATRRRRTEVRNDTGLLGFGTGRDGRTGCPARVEDAIGDGWRELGSARSFPGDDREDKREVSFALSQ